MAPELNLKRLVSEESSRYLRLIETSAMKAYQPSTVQVRMLNFFMAYADYHDLMDLTETLFRELAERLLGVSSFSYQG